jgi:hypothetical protein
MMKRLLLLALITTAACADPFFGVSLDTGATETGGADYPAEVTAVFSGNTCTNAGCHGSGSASGGVSLDEGGCEDAVSGGYAVAGDSAGSPLWIEVDTGDMPIGSGSLSQADLDTIAAWIDGGADCAE